jgi:hypothetical protein
LSFVAGAAAAFVVAAGWNALQSAPVAPAAADQTLGAAMMMASVKYDGTLIESVGLKSAARTDVGRHTLIFERSIRGCSLLGVPSAADTNQSFIAGWIVVAYQDPDNPNGVRIQTRLPNQMLGDLNFQMHVICLK